MYPYNRNDDTIVKASKPSISAEKSMNQRLSKDKQLLALLETADEDTGVTAALYEILSQHPNLENDSAILRTAFLDELKHGKQIQDIYYQITGKSLGKASSSKAAEKPRLPQELVRAIDALFLDELESVDFYRDLLLLMPQGILWDTLFEIMSDKQDHCQRLCYLYSKHK